MIELIQILPRDYLELGAEGRIEEALTAIRRHVGEAKIYEVKENEFFRYSIGTLGN